MKRHAIGIALALGALLAIAPTAASATTITVNGTADTVADTGTCTLREAIGAANVDTASGLTAGECVAGSGADQIVFSASPFNGQVAGATITVNQGVNGPLPSITEDLSIDGELTNGGPCGTLAKPCVGLKINGTADGLHVNSGADLSVTGIAFTQAQAAISADGTLTAHHNWFGIDLQQNAHANNVGIQANVEAEIGGTDAADRNTFAVNTQAGVVLDGADNSTVEGNYFSTRQDGIQAAGLFNGDDVQIANNATGNVIGGADTGSSTVCDGACNLLAGATGAGINLGAATGPTTVKGNFVGLSPDGSQDFGNGGAGVQMGTAGTVTIGGTSVTDRNYIAGNGGFGIDTGNASNLKVQNDFLGLNSTGTAAIPDDTKELQTVANNAVVSNNRIGGETVVIVGNDAVLEGNVIGIGTGGQDVGIDGDAVSLLGSGIQFGGTGLGEGNLIGYAGSVGAGAALSIASGGATVQGNLIGVDASGQAYPNANFGIEIGPSGNSSHNLIGGLGPGEANVISNSVRDAIRAHLDASFDNSIRGNLGRNNGSLPADLFIDLGFDGFGNTPLTGTNEGIQAPVITSATSTQISGTSSEMNGTPVDVYVTHTTRGDVKSFLGTANVGTGGAGIWTLNHSALPDGTCLTAAQTELAAPKGTSELAQTVGVGGVACDVTAPTAGFASGPSGPTNDATPTFDLTSSEGGSTFECRLDAGSFAACPDPFTAGSLPDGDHTIEVRATDPVGNTGNPVGRSFKVDTVAPQTTVTSLKLKQPKKRAKKGTATVAFSSGETGSSFRCKLDENAYAACTSPKTFSGLAAGKHTISVIATDPAGNSDPSAATQKLKIKKPRKKK